MSKTYRYNRSEHKENYNGSKKTEKHYDKRRTVEEYGDPGFFSQSKRKQEPHK